MITYKGFGFFSKKISYEGLFFNLGLDRCLSK
jgi:hypothetical protein